MVLKPDQQRIKDLLSETITLLCRNGLHFKSEFSVEALIGITLDEDDVFLVSIKETVRTADDHLNQAITWKSLSNYDGGHHRVRGRGGGGVEKRDIMHENAILIDDDLRLVAGESLTEDVKSDLMQNLDVNKNASGLTSLAAGRHRETTLKPSLRLNHKRRRKDPAPKSCVQGEIVTLDLDEEDEEIFSGLAEHDIKRQRLLSSSEDAETSPKNDGGVVSSQTNPTEEEEDGERRRFDRTTNFSNDVKRDIDFYSAFDDLESLADATTGETRIRTSPAEQRRFLSSSSFCNGAVSGRHDDDDLDCNRNNENEEDFKRCHDVSYVKSEPGSGGEICTTPVGGRQARLRYGSGISRRFLSRGSTVGIMHPLNVQQAEGAAGCSSWGVSNSQLESSISHNAQRQKWMSTMTTTNSETQETSSVNTDGPPEMTADQALMAVEVLSISGSFINIGSAKAFQHNLRKLSKTELSEVLERMTVPVGNRFCVGLLCTEGASRVFYKIPPPMIKCEALKFYNIDLSVYSNLYYAPVRVPHNVKEPYEWKCMLDMKSPFNLMVIDGMFQ